MNKFKQILEFNFQIKNRNFLSKENTHSKVVHSHCLLDFVSAHPQGKHELSHFLSLVPQSNVVVS